MWQPNGMVADRLYHWALGEAEPSPGMLVDFGIDNQEIAMAYVAKINDGSITLEQLREALGDSKKLSALIGIELKKNAWEYLKEEQHG